MVSWSSRTSYPVLDYSQASIRTLHFSRLTIEVKVCDRKSIRPDLPRRVSKKRSGTLSWNLGECVCSPFCVRRPRRLRKGSAAGTILSGCPSGCPRLSLARNDAEGRTATAGCALQPVRRAFWSVLRVHGHTGEGHLGWGVAWTWNRIQRNAWLRRRYSSEEVMNTRTKNDGTFLYYCMLYSTPAHVFVPG